MLHGSAAKVRKVGGPTNSNIRRLDPLVYQPSHVSSHAVTLPHTNATSKIQNQHVVQSAGVACPLALASCSDADYPFLPTAGNSGNQKAAQPEAIPCNVNATVQSKAGVHYSNPYASHENRGVQETAQTKADSIAIASIGIDRHGDSFAGAQTVAARIGDGAPLLTHSRAESVVQSITFTGPRGSTSIVTYNTHSGIQQGLDPIAIAKAQLIVSSSNEEATKQAPRSQIANEPNCSFQRADASKILVQRMVMGPNILTVVHHMELQMASQHDLSVPPFATAHSLPPLEARASVAEPQITSQLAGSSNLQQSGLMVQVVTGELKQPEFWTKGPFAPEQGDFYSSGAAVLAELRACIVVFGAAVLNI
ncbi:hypothetical protein F0562_001722 [Nyssa sinensis]|uniref:Uncharacterized protein n=1 Tax=Nyssa sinensis TaxID=561372 RepID=A0A5J5C438_9ASTE|nr:hypothetical protein F0562_001722 [Nyssa sinensis]